MKKILVIQSRSRQEMLEAEQRDYERSISGSAEIVFASALDVTRNWEDVETLLRDIDGVIIGGSGEFDLHGGRPEDDPARLTSQEILKRITRLVEHFFEKDMPVLGVCYGHQLIAHMRGGNVTNDHEQKKVGTFPVTLTEEGKQDKIFSALPEEFYAQYGHKDSVTSLPNGATLLCVGPSCKFSALRYGKNIYTVQFHPELRAEDVAWKLENSPGYLPEGTSADSIVKDSTEASRIIPLWIENIVRSD